MESLSLLLIVIVPFVLVAWRARSTWWLPGFFVMALAVFVGTRSDHHEVHGDIPVMSISSEVERTIETLGLFVLGAILLGVGAGASKSTAPAGSLPSPLPVATTIAGVDKPE